MHFHSLGLLQLFLWRPGQIGEKTEDQDLDLFRDMVVSECGVQHIQQEGTECISIPLAYFNSFSGGRVRSEKKQRIKISIYFATWWSLNVVFNIYNKKVLNAFPFPWLTSTLSLAAGSDRRKNRGSRSRSISRHGGL